MGGAAIGAAERLVGQLRTLWPAKTRAQLAALVGITLMPGLDDYPRRTEETSGESARCAAPSLLFSREQTALHFDAVVDWRLTFRRTVRH
jgi:hypothetical protein